MFVLLKVTKIFGLLFISLNLLSCYDASEKKMSREELNDIVETQGRAMLSNSLVQLNNVSYIVQRNIADLPGLLILSPWGFRFEGESSMYDSLRYNHQTQYWSVRFERSNQSYELKYRYESPDLEGNPTSKSNVMYFELKYKNNYPISSSTKAYDVEGTAKYTIKGIKNYLDPRVVGELYYSGSTISHFQYQFSPDTIVQFTYRDNVQNVVLSEQSCVPNNGYFECTMVQDAEPGTFTIETEIEKGHYFSKLKDVPNRTFKDYEFRGKTLFTKDGIHVLADGEDFEIYMPCDSIQSLFDLKN